MTKTERRDLKTHGYVFSSDSDSINSDSGKSEFDEEYYASRPPAVPLQGLENRIVKIKAFPHVQNSQKKIDVNEENAPSTTTSFPIQQNEQKVNKRKATRLKKPGAKSNTAVPSVRNVKTTSSSKGAIPKTVALKHPLVIKTNVNLNKEAGQNNDKMWGKNPFVESGKQMPNHSDFQTKPSLHNKERPFSNVRSTKYTSEWLDTSTSSHQTGPKSTPRKHSHTISPEKHFVRHLSGDFTNNIGLKRPFEVHNYISFTQTQGIASNNTFDPLTSTNLHPSKPWGNTPVKHTPHVNVNQTKLRQPLAAFGNSETPKNLIMQKSVIDVPTCNSVPRLPIFPGRADLNPEKSNHQTVHRSNEAELWKDEIFTISSPKLAVKNKSAHVIERNQHPLAHCYNNPIVVCEPVPVIPTGVSRNIDEVEQTTTLGAPIEENIKSDTSLTDQVVDVFRSCFCCKADDNNYSQFGN